MTGVGQDVEPEGAVKDTCTKKGKSRALPFVFVVSFCQPVVILLGLHYKRLCFSSFTISPPSHCTSHPVVSVETAIPSTSSRLANMVRPAKSLNRDNDLDFDQIWGVLEGALQEIHQKRASNLSFEELYRNAYKIVLKKKGDTLYEKVKRLEESWLRDQVRTGINSLVTPGIILGATGDGLPGQSSERRIAGERFLRALKDAFTDHQLCMGMITDVLMYMVRQKVALLSTSGALLTVSGSRVLP